MSELGGLIFGDRKASDEPGYVNVLNLEGDDEKMQIVVKSIFKKAQTQFAYVDLCSQIVCLELKIKGLEPIRSNCHLSKFRKLLLEYCKSTFEKLIEAPEQFKLQEANYRARRSRD